MEGDLGSIIAAMKDIHGIDISMFDDAFLVKMLEARTRAAGLSGADAYSALIAENSTEATAFYNSLYVNYSRFFRESVTFSLLEQNVFPEIIFRKPVDSEIRIWSAGCAGGQEAYSLAILLADLSLTTGKTVRFRIFATDIAEEALAQGRAGTYDHDAVDDVKVKHLHRYFTKRGDTYTVLPQLRENVYFSVYNLLDTSSASPPDCIYGDFDIIMCSNLLIYYNPATRRSILSKIMQALSPAGYLITGEAEKTIVDNIIKLRRLTAPAAIFRK